jgi:very-short-patch-repair endonuclease
MTETTKNKVRQLYHFLKEANQLRFRPIRQIAEQVKLIRLSEIPDHPSILFVRPIRTADNIPRTADPLLRVRRPQLTPCRKPPAPLLAWLLPTWDDPTKMPQFARSQNFVVKEEFDAASDRVADFATYLVAREVDDGLDVILEPPPSIAAWLKEGWSDSSGPPEVLSSREVTHTIAFDDDAQRVASYEVWLEQRAAWVGPELAARKAMSFYERMYDIYAALEKDGEDLELLVADGHFQWQAVSEVDGSVRISHPLLLKRVDIRFAAEVPEFIVVDTDRETELYSSLFVDLKEVLPVSIRNRNNELEQSRYHPLGWEDTTAFLKAFIQTVSPTKGEYLETPATDAISETPRLFRDMSLLLRRRSSGIANAVNAIIEDIEQRSVFPPALAQITGTVDAWNGESLGDSIGLNSVIHESRAMGGDEILLAKEANEEQLQIIRKLERSGSVIVQGPPGTGKTHTIGNLIGHLLAQGKSILVTAQTSKALRVVRDKIPELLRPLAVSVLGSDQSARQQLESSIGSITERMTCDSPESLLRKAAQFGEEREGLVAQKLVQGQKLRQALENEYREIKVGSLNFSPSDAARRVQKNKSVHSWIPSPVKLGANLTLSVEELGHLYQLGSNFNQAEELDARNTLPDLSLIPNERQFGVMVSEYKGLVTADLSAGEQRWAANKERGSENLAALAADLSNEFSDALLSQAWRPYAIVAGVHGGSGRLVWDTLIGKILVASEAQSQHALVLHHKPQTSDSSPIPIQKKIIEEICEHLSNGGKIGFLQLVTRSEWKQFIKSVSVSAGEPRHPEHFEALRALVNVSDARQSLQPLWDQLIGEHIQRPFSSLGVTPEHACRALIPEILRCLEWNSKTWKPLAERLSHEGFKLEECLSALPREASEVGEYKVIENLATSVLPPLLAAELGRRKLAECEAGFKKFERLARGLAPESGKSGCISQIIQAVSTRNPEAFQESLTYARRLHTVRPFVQERDRLLGELHIVAPVWAEHIRAGIAPHDSRTIPGDVAAAWIWRQLNDELIERDALNANEIQREIDKIDLALREVTLWLIDAKAWGKQLDRLKRNNSIRQSLVGWLDTTKALMSVRQQDRRETLLSEARKLMKRAGEAVPVWVMPISIVAENFDPRTTRFDVVIIDEASQADLNALIPIYLGKQVIVVGDHEQVTPLGVGQGQAMLDNLRKQILEDIPNSHLFDSKFSIYDIARQSFGDGIRLVEHFRCVPEIIAFSNQLSYDGKIRPLRESNSNELAPACVSMKIEGVREKDVNRAEARRIVDLIKAMIAHPRYLNKTIGVISMIGDAQTMLLQSMILKEVAGTEIEKRRIQAGNSSEFQGDERDVIFMSMVDSPSVEGPMRLTGDGAFELTKKRYNVATSRARDQLFVIHSFDPDLHLKPGDLRLRLLQHIRDPLATLRAYHTVVGKTESPFERAVLRCLTDAGYCVKTQWEVGYYRIDMVVEGGGKRLAIECDGDRYHPLEKLAEDIERQTILERLGWQFVRIRGSAFYRDPDDAMLPVFLRLKELEIPPEADMAQPDINDTTLLHELDSIIDCGVVIEQSAVEVSPVESMPFANMDDVFVPFESASGPNEIVTENENAGLVQAEIFDSLIFTGASSKSAAELLVDMGGAAPLDDFLRELAKARGYQRLRNSVREKLMGELKPYLQNRTLDMVNDVIRVL